ncbi:MAG TPA: glutamine synthetase [Balneola sp.]|nr:glutamine synthetase [Balneola sp.]
MTIKLDYLWLDGYETPNIRSKTKYLDIDYDNVNLDTIPEWGFDGSSTKQAEGDSSDCILKPVKVYNNTIDFSGNSYIVLCEVMNTDGTPHESNTRAKLREVANEDLDMWFGIEQEYVFMNPETGRPYGWPEIGFPKPQGRYYCGVGGDAVRLRRIVEDHAYYCIEAGIPLAGTNAEVMLSQWEYQIGTAGTIEVCDDLWVARYMLEILAERQGVSISLSPKPVEGDWNGSGAHINFSTKKLREKGGKEYITRIIKEFMDSHEEHIDEYGLGNDKRLTGEHETQHIDVFSSGDSDRGASIRIPPVTAQTYKGYLEDRRPAANMDPYRAVAIISNSVSKAELVHMIPYDSVR